MGFSPVAAPPGAMAFQKILVGAIRRLAQDADRLAKALLAMAVAHGHIEDGVRTRTGSQAGHDASVRTAVVLLADYVDAVHRQMLAGNVRNVLVAVWPSVVHQHGRADLRIGYQPRAEGIALRACPDHQHVLFMVHIGLDAAGPGHGDDVRVRLGILQGKGGRGAAIDPGAKGQLKIADGHPGGKRARAPAGDIHAPQHKAQGLPHGLVLGAIHCAADHAVPEKDAFIPCFGNLRPIWIAPQKARPDIRRGQKQRCPSLHKIFLSDRHTAVL